MPWKNTHRWIKRLGKASRLWLEEDETASVEMTLADEQDSASVRLDYRSKGSFSPNAHSALEIRISYADLRELVHAGQEILVKHADQIEDS